MSNQSIHIEKKAITLNNKKGNLVTTYYLKQNALGGFDWHRQSVNFEKSDDDLIVEKQYAIKSKEAVRLNGVFSTIFEVFELNGDKWVKVGTSSVKSKGVARDTTCLKAWLNHGY